MLSTKERIPPFILGAQYARMNNVDEAMVWLEKAYEERDFRLTHIGVAVEFDSLRGDARFKELLKKIGLP
jgi:hypothetical protein